MSDLIAHLQSHVNRPANIETSSLDSCDSSLRINASTIASRRASGDGTSLFNEPELGTRYARSSEDQGSVSKRALESRLAAGPPLKDARPRHRRRAPLRARPNRPTYWLSCTICESVRLINDRGLLYHVDVFKQAFGPILALHIIRERARPDSLMDTGGAAARQVRLLVCAEIAVACETWVRGRLSTLRDAKPYQIWRTAGSQSRRGGFKELGVSLGQHFGLTQAERQRLKIRMIRAVDLTPNDQREVKREADRARAAAKRRAAGVKQRATSEAVKTMMREKGLSRASCYRRLAAVKAAEISKDHEAMRMLGVKSNTSPHSLLATLTHSIGCISN